MRLRNIAIPFLASFMALGSVSAFAQGIITGSITGTVQDPSGAVIPSAQIVAKNVTTGVVQTLTANAAGNFDFSSLPVGAYNLTITSSGFAPLQLNNIVVSTGVVTGLGAEKLSTGTATETVEVSSAASLLETAQSQISTTFTQEQIGDLPTGGGFDELALLIPGVASTRSNNFANTNGASISSNGQRGRSNNFELDGQSNNDNSVSGPQAFFSNQDGLAEVQVITNNFSAQYGRDAGSVVNYVTKSGTNTYHGSAFEFYSGSFLNSLRQSEKSPYFGYCAPGVATGTNGCLLVKRARSDVNRFGGSFGGPILKDKLFGFGSALFSRNFAGATASFSGTGANGYFPTPAAIATLASVYPTNPGVQSLVAYNPFTIAAGNPVAVGNAVNVSVTDGTTATTIPVSQYSRFLPAYSTDEEVLGRLDYQMTPHDRFYLRYFYQLNPTIAGSGTIATGGYVNVNDKVHSVGGDWTHTFSDHFTNQLRYSFQQSNLTFDGGGFSACTVGNLAACPSSFGVSTSLATPTIGGGAVTSVNIGSFGLATNLPQGRIVKDNQAQDNANYVLGKHTIAFGASFEYQNSPNVFLPTANGGYNFGSSGSTAAPIPGLNGLLQGYTSLSLAGGSPNIHFTEPDWAAYIQDDWRVTPSFTANIGVRWEYFTSSINLLHNVSLANQTGPNPLWNTSLPLSVTTFPSVAEDYKHFEPRIGFAYNPTSIKSLVVRGAYSVNIAPAFYNIFLNSYTVAPVVLAATVTNCNNNAVGATAAKPCIPTGGSNISSIQAQDRKYLPLGANPGQFNQTLEPSNFRQPYTQTYTLGVQYEVSHIAVVEARYVGSHTVGDFQTSNNNPGLAPLANSFPNILNPASLCQASGSTLPGGIDIGHLRCGATNVRYRANSAFIIYNALQTQATFRAYHGLTANVGYTFSRAIDNVSEAFSSTTTGQAAVGQNPFDGNVAERGVSLDSYPNVTSVGLNYVDPHFKQNHSLVGRVLGGFQLNTIYLFNSGQAYTPYQSVSDQGGSFCDNAFNTFSVGFDACRPILNNIKAPLNQVGFQGANHLYFPKGTTAAQATNRAYAVDPSVFHWLVNNQAEALTLGNPFAGVGRNTLRGTSYNNVDASIFKNNKLTERINMQLQLQVNNVMNRGFYGIPDAAIDDSNAAGTSTFATVKGNTGTRRTTTLGARILF